MPDAPLPEWTVWTSKTFAEPPSTDATDILEDDEVLRRWLEHLVGFGLARLRNAPTEDDFLDPDSTANTGLGLGQHTDLPSSETPPGYQFLHCVANDVAGASSRMTDGLGLIEELQQHHPHHYDALTALDWVWFNRQRTDDHRWIGPVIDHGGPQNPVTIRGFYPVRSFPFTPGDVIGFDNRQVLHGHDAYDSSGRCERRLRGCYLDREDLLSTARVVCRHMSSNESLSPTELSSSS